MNIRHFDITKISVIFQYAIILHAVMLLLCSRVPDNLSMQGVYKEFQCQVNFHLALQITITKFSSNLTCNVTVPVGFFTRDPLSPPQRPLSCCFDCKGFLAMGLGEREKTAACGECWKGEREFL